MGRISSSIGSVELEFRFLRRESWDMFSERNYWYPSVSNSSSQDIRSSSWNWSILLIMFFVGSDTYLPVSGNNSLFFMQFLIDFSMVIGLVSDQGYSNLDYMYI